MLSTDNDNGSFDAYYGDNFPCKRSSGQILSVFDQNRSLNRIFLIQNTLQQTWVYCTGYYLIDRQLPSKGQYLKPAISDMNE